MTGEERRGCLLTLGFWLVLLAYHLHGASGQTCSFELVTDPPRPVGGNNWIFFFRCLNGNLPAGYNNTLPICYRNYYTGAPCGGNDVEPKTFLRDTYTLDKLGNQAFAGNFATDPNVPASRLRALFGANAWGIQSPDGAPCTFTFAVAPLPPRPDGFTGSDEELCKRKEATDSDWTPVGSTVEMRESANAGVSTASITQPSSTSITGFSGTSQTFTIQVTNPVKSCCQLPPPTVVSSPAGIVACSAPPSGTNGWFAPNAADNTCELSFSCSLVAAGSAIVNITQSNWDASATLVQQEITVNVQTTTFAITPSSTSLSRISGTSQLFNVTVSNLPLTRTCSGLQLPTFVVTNPAVATCSIAGGATAYSADNGGPCTLGISCSFTSSAGTTSTTSITITAGDGSSNPVATQTTTVFVCTNFGSGTWTVRGGTGFTSYNCTCLRVPGTRNINCTNCFSAGAAVPGNFMYEVPCNCPNIVNGVVFTTLNGGQLFCNTNPCVWQVVTDPPMPTTEAEYLLALVCSSGDVFTSGLSTSAPICYRAEPEASYSLTYPSLAVAANSQNLGLAATPTRANETTRLTAFTRSSNAWVAKRPARDTARTAAKVWVARAIPPTIQNPSFTCPAASAGLETAANNTLTVNTSTSLRGAITAATNGNANVGNVTNSAGNWSTFNIPVTILAPGTACALLADPVSAGSTSLTVTPIEPSTSSVASCSSMGIFRAAAPVQGNGGSCVLDRSITCTASGWGQARVTIPLSGVTGSAWAGANALGPQPITVQINVCTQLTSSTHLGQCGKTCQFVDSWTRRRLVCHYCCEDPLDRSSKCDVPAGPYTVPCNCADVAYEYNEATGGSLRCTRTL